MASIDDLKSFPVATAEVSLWVYKRRSPKGADPVFTGRWVKTSADLDQAMREAVEAERNRITEVTDYSLLAQPNESSALTITSVETHAGLMVAEAADQTAAKKVTRVKQIENTEFYAIKMIANGQVLYAIKKTDSSWRTSRNRQLINAVFSDLELKVASDPEFRISRGVDFFVVGSNLLISDKGNFESVLSYRQAHEEDFKRLQQETDFTGVFTSLDALLDYVGTNKIQLRRACAIRQKAYYKNKIFMDNLRKNAEKFKLKIQFDADGKIIPTSDNCRDIMQALLDHRLVSGFSNNIYDVQDTSSPIQ